MKSPPPPVLLLALTVVGLAGGAGAWVAGAERAGELLWALTALAGLIPVLASLLGALRRGAGSVDVIAVMAVAGALALGEYLAGAVIGLMLATGRALESFAASRAQRELTALLQRAPRTAHRVVDHSVETVSVDAVVPRDRLIVKDGDIVPVDGVLLDSFAVIDESALTGESKPVERRAGDQVRSGTVNAGPSFQMLATSPAEASTYAGIVRMVAEAQRSKAPLVRLADRYARFFVPTTLLVAGVAWAISGSPTRGLAVLVVATPCPLLLAAPIAIISGVSRAARRGIVVKGGSAVETLARATAVYLDKTGTLTLGAPRLQNVLLARADIGENDLLRYAASLDQVSSHVFAAALVMAARDRGLVLSLPNATVETQGAGIEGRVDGHLVRVGNFEVASQLAPVPEEHRRLRRRALREGGSVVFVWVDEGLAGAFVFDDPIRAEAPRVIRQLKRLGVQDVVMLTGDHASVADAVGEALGVDHVQSNLAPEEKVEAVRRSAQARVTLMVGDGINDAPALAAADVGVAMGARGATSSSEAADVVLTVDRLDRLVDAVRISQRARAIAIQSILLGMGLSFGAMGLALFGLLPPVAGAFLQEGIDALAIVNALRALGGGLSQYPAAILPSSLVAELREEHHRLGPRVEELRLLADRMDRLPADELAGGLNKAREAVDELVAHEQEDEEGVYRRIADSLGGEDPLAAMSRTHREIFHLARAFERAAADVAEGLPAPEDLVDIRRLLYALHAVMRLNIAQEEELYAAVGQESPA